MEILDKPQKKEVSKVYYLAMVWGILTLGVLINAIFYFMLSKTLETRELQFVGLLGFGMLLIGYSMGLAYARSYKIKEVDN